MGSERMNLFCEILFAIILPPLGVCLRFGCCNCEFLVCVLLTLLGYVPGIIFAIYVIIVKGDDHLSNSHGYYASVS